MSQQALLKRIVEAPDEAGVPSMLTGSLASSLQGEPRATHDIDVVVDISPADVGRVTRALSGPHIYLDEWAARLDVAAAPATIRTQALAGSAGASRRSARGSHGREGLHLDRVGAAARGAEPTAPAP